MASSKSRLVYLENDRKIIGGTLVSRRAGRGQRNRYYYIQYYDPKSQSGKGQVYLGSYRNLAHVAVDDKRYETVYKPLILQFSNRLHGITSLKELEDRDLGLTREAFQLLLDMGWSKKLDYVRDKISADLEELYVLEEEQGFIADGLKFDHKTIHALFNAKTNAQYGKIFFDAYRRFRLDTSTS